jgi:beta-glucosidase
VDWEIYPEGLYNFIMPTMREYTNNLPLYVTENGMASDDQLVDGAVYDQAWLVYIDAHITQVQRAMREGAPLNGYFLWSLMENHDWIFRHEKRFGLVHVDFESLQRTPKASYHALIKRLNKVLPPVKQLQLLI